MQILAGVLLAAAITPVPAKRVAERPVALAVGQQQRPRVEVAFVLDTTGSMGGLIEGAKRRIWSIARAHRRGPAASRPAHRPRRLPRPRRRLRHAGPRLHADMDDVYAQPLGVPRRTAAATGRSTSPRALSDAVQRVSWSRARRCASSSWWATRRRTSTTRTGFDYRRHVARGAPARHRASRPSSAAGTTDTAAVWREIASAWAPATTRRSTPRAACPSRVTPVDAELARLNAELVGARWWPGGTVARAGGAAGRLDARARPWPRPWPRKRRATTRRRRPLADKDLVDLPVAEQKQASWTRCAARARRRRPRRARRTREALAVPARAEGRAARSCRRRIRTCRRSATRTWRRTARPGTAFDEQVVPAPARSGRRRMGVRF